MNGTPALGSRSIKAERNNYTLINISSLKGPKLNGLAQPKDYREKQHAMELCSLTLCIVKGLHNGSEPHKWTPWICFSQVMKD